MKKANVIVSFIFLVLPLQGFAQEYVVPTAAHLGVNLQDSQSLVRVTVSVTLKDTPVTDLKKEDFVILEDGVPQPVVKFSPVPPAMNTAIVLDCSASMRGRETAVKKAVHQFVNADTLDQDRFAIICAANHNQQFLLSELTSDREKISKGIDQYLVWGGTYIAEAIERSMAYLNLAAPGEFNQVVVISDGHDLKSQNEIEETLLLSAKEQTAIDVIAVRSSQTTVKDTAYLRALTNETGGIYVSTDRPSGLEKAFQEMTVGVASRYTLWYQSDTNAKTSNIEIKVLNRPELELSYERHVYLEKGASEPVTASPIPPLPPSRVRSIVHAPVSRYSSCRDAAAFWELGDEPRLIYKGPVIKLAPSDSNFTEVPSNPKSYFEISDPTSIVGTCYLENHNATSATIRSGMSAYLDVFKRSYDNRSAYEISAQSFTDSRSSDYWGRSSNSFDGLSLRCQLSRRGLTGEDSSIRLEELRPLLKKVFDLDLSHNPVTEDNCGGGSGGSPGGHS